MNSPLKNQNKGYESTKQEKYDLMHDNPVAKDASGGRSWMSKHASQSKLGSVKHHGSPAHNNAGGLTHEEMADYSQENLDGHLKNNRAHKRK